ncbi:hypothetical protein ZHAS_00015459 [Anopheles sinensis]|uniref:Ig-like domain-containing protein n=1 Tax=Anopheles sinensis TaxID=74873 RepID=A0A084WAU7_ANOSI|nr:hypothetical protein ZHAS_00015459 [Anopheles sinensis]
MERRVSWIRHRDIHILTVGSYTYTSDQRFQATHHKNTDDWTLQIKWAQKRDAGIYECQISTQPVRSYFVTLSVVVSTSSPVCIPFGTRPTLAIDPSGSRLISDLANPTVNLRHRKPVPAGKLDTLDLHWKAGIPSLTDRKRCNYQKGAEGGEETCLQQLVRGKH